MLPAFLVSRLLLSAKTASPVLVLPVKLSTSAALLKGHSKWQNIKAVKGKNDALKSQALNYLLKKVSQAVKKGGFDIKLNSELAALEKEFRTQSLPIDTFKNFLKKLKDKPEVVHHFHLIGPSGSFFIIETESSQNRSALENIIRKYINKTGGFRTANDVAAVLAWFDEKGIVRMEETLKDGKQVAFEAAEETGIDLNCEQVDVVADVDGRRKIEMTCDPVKVASIESELTKRGYVIEQAGVEFRPKHPVSLPDSDMQLVEKLYGFLQEDENISQIYDNVHPS